MGGPHGRRGPMPQAAQLRLDDLGTPLIEVTFVVVDFETTGVDPSSDRITEVGAVRCRAGQVEAELATMIDPGRPLPPAITAITGITDRMLRGCPRIEAVLPSLTELLRGGVFVAHNASFDQRFLDAALERSGRDRLDVPILDTARLARRILDQEVQSVRLSVLARHLGARTTPNHRALPDARATLDVLHALIERATAFGVVTLEDLLDLQRSTTHRTYKRVDLVRGAPSAPGTYRFVGPDEEVLYVGTTGDLRTRLRRYFGQDKRRRTTDLVLATERVEWTVCPTAIEANVREVRQIHEHRPRFNRRSKHPEKAAWISLTREPFPRLVVVGRPPTGAPALGPLPNRRTAADVVEAIEQATAIRPCRMRLRVRQDHAPCILAELGRCAAPCDGSQSREDYDRIVAGVAAMLNGDATGMLRDLRATMRVLGSTGRFEHAADARRRLHAAGRAMARTRTLNRLAAAERLVAHRPDGTGGEGIEVRRGRLVRSWSGPQDDPGPPAPTLATAGPTVADLAAIDVEECLLVAAWLDRAGTVVVHVEGVWASPVAGGRLVEEIVREERRLARTLRRDRIALGEEKVARAPGAA